LAARIFLHKDCIAAFFFLSVPVRDIRPTAPRTCSV